MEYMGNNASIPTVPSGYTYLSLGRAEESGKKIE